MSHTLRYLNPKWINFADQCPLQHMYCFLFQVKLYVNLKYVIDSLWNFLNFSFQQTNSFFFVIFILFSLFCLGFLPILLSEHSSKGYYLIDILVLVKILALYSDC